MIDCIKESGAKLALVSGTGLTIELEAYKKYDFGEIRGLPQTTTRHHKGTIELADFNGQPIVQVCGRIHTYETANSGIMRPVYETLMAAGIKNVLISGAVGSMNQDLPPGKLAQIGDHLFFGGGSPLTGIPNAFIDMSHAYQQNWAPPLIKATYAWAHGPQLETPAEIRALKLLGGDVVGMSMAPEVILARYFDLRVYALAGVVNWAAGYGDHISIKAIMNNAGKAAKRIPTFVETLIETL